MKAHEFLFPTDLQVSEVRIKKILFVGSCLSVAFCKHIRSRIADCQVDHILFNNLVDLPKKNNDEIRSYDLQYIQIPLRSLLTDGFVRKNDNERKDHDWASSSKQILKLMLEKALQYSSQTGILTLVSNFIVPQGMTSASLDRVYRSDDIGAIVGALNNELVQLISGMTNVFVADLDAIGSTIGKRHFLDDIITFNTHGSVVYPDWSGHERKPYWTSPEPGRIDALPDLNEFYENKVYDYFDAVVRQIEVMYRIVHQIDMVKLVVFDLDNTLWRGQIAEHYKSGERWPYFDGWPLGIWESIHLLKRRGILVSVCSKNDLDYVKEHWKDAVPLDFLRFDDFLLPKINWKPKADNIKETIEQLSLTPKSVVFVDDNPVERESVASQIPGIRVIGSNPFLTRRILLWAPETNIAHLSGESDRREEMLKKKIDRDAAQSAMGRDEFLRSLNTKVQLWRFDDVGHKSFSRVLELVNKTNQFNTTGIRWNAADYNEFFDNDGELYVFQVSDRFVDYGIVGVCFVKNNTIVQFIMSCRVLGMDIEVSVLRTIVSSIREIHGDVMIYAKFVETETNKPCRGLFPDSGFVWDDDQYVLKGQVSTTAGAAVVSAISA